MWETFSLTLAAVAGMSLLAIWLLTRLGSLRAEIDQLRKELQALRDRLRGVASAPGPSEAATPAGDSPSAAAPASPVATGAAQAASPAQEATPESPAARAPQRLPEPVGPVDQVVEHASDRPVEPVPAAPPASEPAPVPAAALASASLAARSVPAAKATESRSAWTELERHIGTRWAVWLGAVILIMGAAMFVKYAFEHGWLGPLARVASGLACGVALLVIGDRALRRGRDALGQGLMGAGLAIAQGSVYAAHAYYDLISNPAAFAGMVAVTAIGMGLAAYHRAAGMAAVALVGGFLTPGLLSTGVDRRDALFAYVLVLDVGALALVIWRRIRWIDLLAVAGTWTMFGGWADAFGAAAVKTGAWGGAAAWAAGLWLLWALGTAAPLAVRRVGARLEQAVLLGANAFVGTVLLVRLLGGEDALGARAAILLGLVAVHALLAHVLTRRLPGAGGGAPDLFGWVAAWLWFLAFEGLFATAEAIQPVLIACGAALLGALAVPARVRSLTLGGAPLVGVAALMVFLEDFSAGAPLLCSPAVGAAGGVFVAAVVAALLGAVGRPRGSAVRSVVASAAGVALLALLGTAHGDLVAHGWNDAPAILWAAAALALAVFGARSRRPMAQVIGAVCLLVSLTTAAEAYHGYRLLEGSLPALNARFLGAALLSLAAFVVAGTARLPAAIVPEGARAWLLWIALVVTFGFFTAEVLAFTEWSPGAEALSTSARDLTLTLVWAGFALTLLVVGFAGRFRWLRLNGLLLLGVTAAKLLLRDLNGAGTIHRVIAFLLVGSATIGASYLYHRLEKRLG